MTFTYTITNTSQPGSMDTGPVTGIELFDYFNFHPDGTDTTNNSINCGTTSYANGTISVVPLVSSTCPSSWAVADGSMSGSSVPAQCAIYSAADPNELLLKLQNLQTTPLNGDNCSTTSSGDYAGALVWDLASLPDETSETFTITKEATPFLQQSNDMPEPASLALFGTAIIGLAGLRRHTRT